MNNGRGSATLRARAGRSAARAVGLVYVSDELPGIRRMRRGQGFVYRTPRGRTIRDPKTLKRIRALAIPPAWTSVWICPDARGHIQATGLDARGRKQYRYHAAWRSVRDATKFHRLQQFADALAEIRKHVDQAFALPGLPREKIVAAVVRLMDSAHLRVGNLDYAESNGSYGVTTLLNRHADVRGDNVRLKFRGKSGQPFEIELHDARLARVVKRCSDLPGQTLFQYVDDEGQPHRIGSGDVNHVLREWTGEDFTAKDFRTWAGSVHFLRAVRNGMADSRLREVVKEVARKLGNTPAVCQKFYIHPALMDAFSAGRLQNAIESVSPRGRKRRWLDENEQLLIEILKARPAKPKNLKAALEQSLKSHPAVVSPPKRVRTSPVM